MYYLNRLVFLLGVSAHVALNALLERKSKACFLTHYITRAGSTTTVPSFFLSLPLSGACKSGSRHHVELKKREQGFTCVFLGPTLI